MGCFFGCFRGKDKQHIPPPKPRFDSAPATGNARVSQNPLSDLFASREIEDSSCHGKTTPPKNVDIQGKDMEKHMEFYSGNQPVHPFIPAKHSDLEKVFDSFEETPTSCISDLQNVGRVSGSTTEKNTSSATPSSTSPDAHSSHNWVGFDVAGNQTCSFQKHKNRPTSSQEDLNGQESLSSWLKPVHHNKVGNKVSFRDEVGRTIRTPGDRPILGTVAAYWNEEVEPSTVPKKWWDGNGIPNSTNKYREDQKVSWHVTPFEERLEKALSEEKLMSQRKHISGAHMAFEETNNDTAGSQLQSLPHPKSVVSF